VLIGRWLIAWLTTYNDANNSNQQQQQKTKQL
jgi:hypothetical protein